MKINKETKKRFLEKIKKTDKCWEWIGAKNNKGYGRIRINKKTYSTHRISYNIHKGDIPEGIFVCHKCDNPPCVNPEHLFLGTRSDNMKDAFNKGRLKPLIGKKFESGENNIHSKLSEKQVKRIRKDGEKATNLAKEFNVSVSIIFKIRQGIRWKGIL